MFKPQTQWSFCLINNCFYSGFFRYKKLKKIGFFFKPGLFKRKKRFFKLKPLLKLYKKKKPMKWKMNKKKIKRFLRYIKRFHIKQFRVRRKFTLLQPDFLDIRCRNLRFNNPEVFSLYWRYRTPRIYYKKNYTLLSLWQKHIFFTPLKLNVFPIQTTVFIKNRKVKLKSFFPFFNKINKSVFFFKLINKLDVLARNKYTVHTLVSYFRRQYSVSRWEDVYRDVLDVSEMYEEGYIDEHSQISERNNVALPKRSDRKIKKSKKKTKAEIKKILQKTKDLVKPRLS